MKKVLTFGVFDLLHIGHIKLFYNARQLGNSLIVAVQDSEWVTRFKPNTKLYYSTEERVFMVGSIRYVDKTIVYTSVDEAIKEIEFDILAVGPDQCHKHFQNAFEWCTKFNKEIVVIPRTEGISSSFLRTSIHKE